MAGTIRCILSMCCCCSVWINSTIHVCDGFNDVKAEVVTALVIIAVLVVATSSILKAVEEYNQKTEQFNPVCRDEHGIRVATVKSREECVQILNSRYKAGRGLIWQRSLEDDKSD